MYMRSTFTDSAAIEQHGISTAVGSQTADITVHVRQVGMAAGRVFAAVFNNEASHREALRSVTEDNVRKQMYCGVSMPAEKGSMKFEFPRLPHGDYSVLVFHDLNDNGELDVNPLGNPVEPWGGSFAKKPRFGAPGWADSSFALGARGRKMVVRLSR